ANKSSLLVDGPDFREGTDDDDNHHDYSYGNLSFHGMEQIPNNVNNEHIYYHDDKELLNDG
ncbi:hypothetical protein KI387_038043, partial [Taxus chinensis]